MDAFLTVINLLGGLGIFLLGLEYLSSGTKNLGSRKLRYLFETFLKNKVGGVFMGALLALFFQSSSAASVVLVGFVDASIITFAKTLPVLLGTGIGTTVTAQIISFNPGSYALLFVGAGFFIKTFTKGAWSHSGLMILGLGMLFFGMGLMTNGLEPLSDNQGFIDLILHLERPLAGFVIGLIFTAIIQSSAAFIGILITLCNSGLLSFDASLPLILGTNVGTTITALLAAINASYPGRKLSVANALFRLAGALIFIGLLTPWAQLTDYISGDNASNARLLANAHTLFNVVAAIFLLPFCGVIGMLAGKIVKTPAPANTLTLKHLNDELIASPTLSLPFLKREVQDMGEVVYTMVEICMKPFFNRDKKSLEQIHQMEEKVDFYREEINGFLVKMNEKHPMEEWSEEYFRMLHAVNELEQVADIVSVNIARQAEKWLETDISFSPEGYKELDDYHKKCLKQLERATTLMHNWNPHDAITMKRKYRNYALMAFDFERKHYKRLLSVNPNTIESSKVHMELLNLLRVINSRATNFGRLVFMSDENSPMP